ncbi:MAG: hypothetical protein ACYCT1_12540 [Steroidobacteraceae bacterium]
MYTPSLRRLLQRHIAFDEPQIGRHKIAGAHVHHVARHHLLGEDDVPGGIA